MARKEETFDKGLDIFCTSCQIFFILFDFIKFLPTAVG